MNSNLEKIGITTEGRYECIYTTIDSEGNKNSAAIGLKYFGEDNIGCRIYKIVDDAKREEYISRVNENNRMISRIGDHKTKEAMELIKEEYEKN